MATRTLPALPPGSLRSLRLGALTLALAAGTFALAGDDKDKPKPEPRKVEARQEKREEKREQKQEARQERHEQRVETRQERREERREARPEPRAEVRHETRPERREERREAPRPQPLPRPAEGRPPEVRTEARPQPRLEPRPDHRPESRPDVRPEPRPAPVPRTGPARIVVRTKDGAEIHRTATGAIREVHTTTGAVIRHTSTGTRIVEVTRPGNRVIVANATGRAGYVQRPVVVRNVTLVQRTYVINGVVHPRIYRPWTSGAYTYAVYARPRYYRPAFYTWVYRPWARPVRWRWGWEARPWYGYYGGYFTPYPTYGSPSLWLADFLIASTLEAAFVAQNVSSAAPPVTYGTSTPLTPEVKQAIADEVRRQMDEARLEEERYERAPAQSAMSAAEAPAIFSAKGPRVFLVNTPITAHVGIDECPLVEGDVLQVLQTPSPTAEWADVWVMASRNAACPKGTALSIRIADLQEMQNHMQATVDQGLAQLQEGSGKEGLPPLPADAAGSTASPFASALQADPQAAAELATAAREANAAEQAVIAQGPADGPAPGTVTLGMTPAEVEAILGRPKNTVDLGAKKIHVYGNLKVTFLNGRVSDVQ